MRNVEAIGRVVGATRRSNMMVNVRVVGPPTKESEDAEAAAAG